MCAVRRSAHSLRRSSTLDRIRLRRLGLQEAMLDVVRHDAAELVHLHRAALAARLALPGTLAIDGRTRARVDWSPSRRASYRPNESNAIEGEMRLMIQHEHGGWAMGVVQQVLGYPG